MLWISTRLIKKGLLDGVQPRSYPFHDTGLKLGNRIKGIIALSGYIPAIVKDDYEISSLDGVKAFISHGSTIKSFHMNGVLMLKNF